MRHNTPQRQAEPTRSAPVSAKIRSWRTQKVRGRLCHGQSRTWKIEVGPIGFAAVWWSNYAVDCPRPTSVGPGSGQIEDRECPPTSFLVDSSGSTCVCSGQCWRSMIVTAAWNYAPKWDPINFETTPYFFPCITLKKTYPCSDNLYVCPNPWLVLGYFNKLVIPLTSSENFRPRGQIRTISLIIRWTVMWEWAGMGRLVSTKRIKVANVEVSK